MKNSITIEAGAREQLCAMISEKLFALQDQKYQSLQSKLMPTVPPETIIGVRTPLLRKLAKQPDKALPWLTERRLDIWTHNKTIQKAAESYRISAEMKQQLRELSIQNHR